VYFDNAATTRVDDWVIARMMPFSSESYGNAPSLHGYGTEAKECQEECRKSIQYRGRGTGVSERASQRDSAVEAYLFNRIKEEYI
jgi:hypothetical protein